MVFLLCFLLVVSSCASAPASVPSPSTPQQIQVDDDRDGDVPEGESETPGEEEEEDFFVYGEIPDGARDLPVLAFTEIWAYLSAGREQALKVNFPISDLFYFGAEIDAYGKLTDVPNRKKITRFPGRVHLVVVCNSRPLTHFILEPESTVRKRLIADLLEAAGPYDGLQIDFELIPARDGTQFLSFLKELRDGLGGKLFTIALPARRRTLEGDVFDYGRIQPLVDRIFVMAYDEHWSTSEPGPIASMGWCRAVADYALKTLGPKKLVMGLPFYGRTWGNLNPNRAFFHSGIERIRAENKVSEVRRENGVPSFTYQAPVTVTVYYEDVYSLTLRGGMYRDMGVRAIGFWTLGQEDPSVWNFLTLNENTP
jgi:spore germination protein YaaH